MMEKIRIPEEIPVYGTYDIVVIGAGPAGCGAALAAARHGRKTLLIERFNSLGGMWTTGFMNPLFDHENKDGILSELINELKEKKSWDHEAMASYRVTGNCCQMGEAAGKFAACAVLDGISVRELFKQ